MIISDRHRMAFIHIPKCAGSTIVRDLEPLNDFHRDRSRPFLHPRNGPISAYHMPLAVVQEFFPEQFAKLVAYDSYGIVREPRARFISAFFQYAVEFHGAKISRSALPDLKQMIGEVRTQLESRTQTHSFELMYFQKQVSFIRLDGDRIVRHLYPIEELARLAADMQARHGIAINADVKINERHLARNPLSQAIRNLAGPAERRIVSPGARRLLRRAFQSMTTAPATRLHQDLYEDGALLRFVDDYYAEDGALYHAMRDDAARISGEAG